MINPDSVQLDSSFIGGDLVPLKTCWMNLFGLLLESTDRPKALSSMQTVCVTLLSTGVDSFTYCHIIDG